MARTIFLTILLGAGALAVWARGDAEDPCRSALNRALDDERRAEAYYAAVIREHGERRPFSRIIHAERRHRGALLAQYERLGIAAPENPWDPDEIEVPDSFERACDEAVYAEWSNAHLYDELAAAACDGTVRGVFHRLGRASIERHLPAMRRHGSGWAPTDPETLDASQREQRTRAERARDAMFAELFAELSHAMGGSGPESAIGVCAQRAPEIAREIAQTHGVEIGRTSWKRRNPKNTPPVWAEPFLSERPESVRVVEHPSGSLGLLSPIRVAGSCLRCHGEPDALAEGVPEALSRLYPEDRATGFREGDLRGWFWIEVPPGGE